MSRERRAAAAARYRPNEVRLLVVAEAPPKALERYFFFEDVRTADWLFRGICKVVLGWVPERSRKHEGLAALRDRGVFLIDLCDEPKAKDGLRYSLPDLVARVTALAPKCVILVKVNVYDIAFRPLWEAGIPVVDKRIPFPANGWQRQFEKSFADALELCK